MCKRDLSAVALAQRPTYFRLHVKLLLQIGFEPTFRRIRFLLNRYMFQLMKTLKEKLRLHELRDAKTLILDKEGVADSLCLQFYRRKDGTILTQDCPVGVLRFRRGVFKVVGALAACLTLVFGFFGVARATSNGSFDKLVHRKPTLSKLYHWIKPDCSACLPLMGLVVPPTPPKP